MIPITDDEPGGQGADGRATRWAGHRSSRRQELVHAARRAVHHLGPAISMDEIATEIGTSKSILYRYFQDKTGLQSAVGQVVLERMRDALATAAAQANGPRERITAMVSVYLELVAASPNVYAFVTRPEAAAAAGALRGFVAEVTDLVAITLLPAIRDEPAPGEPAAGAPGTSTPGTAPAAAAALAQLWAAGVVGLVRGAAERWLAEQTDPAAAQTHPAASEPVDPVPTATPVAATAPMADLGGVDQGDAVIAAMTRDELAMHLSRWLWDGAVGVTRRARQRPAGPPTPGHHPADASTDRPPTPGRNDAEPR